MQPNKRHFAMHVRSAVCLAALLLVATLSGAGCSADRTDKDLALAAEIACMTAELAGGVNWK